MRSEEALEEDPHEEKEVLIRCLKGKGLDPMNGRHCGDLLERERLACFAVLQAGIMPVLEVAESAPVGRSRYGWTHLQTSQCWLDHQYWG